MNEKLKEFLDAKKEAEKRIYEEKKAKDLIELGLFEKVYSQEDKYSNEFPYLEYDGNSTSKWYRKEAIAISDEEYEEAKKYTKPQIAENDKNSIATILRIIGIIVYIVGFIASFYLGTDGYGDISGMVIVWWMVFFIAGTFYLGFAEIIQLLNDIKNR